MSDKRETDPTADLPLPIFDKHVYPMVLTDQRELPEDYRGVMVLCDIDNTYLVTEYRRFVDFIRLGLESARDKQPVPGAPALLRGLRQGFEPDAPRTPVYFVSASPESMRAVLEKRFLLDGVEYDGASFRDLWSRGKPHLRHIKDIYGYKMAALLAYRARHPGQAREILLGDGLEHDAEVYVLYARVCKGEIRGAELDRILEHRRVRAKDRAWICALAETLPEHDPVEAILIRRLKSRLKDEDVVPFAHEDPRIAIFGDYLEAALLLRSRSALTGAAVFEVARAVAEDPTFRLERCLEALHSQDTAAAAIATELESELRRLIEPTAGSNELETSETKPTNFDKTDRKDPTMTDSPETPAEKPADAAPEADAAPAEPTFKDEITFDEFMKLDMRIATVQTCEIVEGADRLLKLELEVGGATRTVVSGIRQWYKPEDMVGRQVIYLANLKPRKLRGIMSQGMVLAASDGDDVRLLKADAECAAGSSVS